MAQHLGTEIVEMVWQKPLHELDGDVLRKEAHRRLESIAAMAERECSDLASYVEAIREGDLWLKLADDWETVSWQELEYPEIALADGGTHYLPPTFALLPCDG